MPELGFANSFDWKHDVWQTERTFLALHNITCKIPSKSGKSKTLWQKRNLKKSRASEGFYATIAAVIVIELSLDCHRNLRESYCVCDDWCRIPLLPRCLLSMLSFYWPLAWSMPEKPALSPEAAAQGSFSMRNSGHMMQQTKHHFISFSRPFSS